jgi:hypothetical protein
MLALLGLSLLSAPALAGEWRTMLGGEFNADPHGAMDVGWRSGDWQAQLITDTIDVRWQPEHERGRSWLAARAEFGAAGLMISPWADGAPLPEAALTAFYAGTEGGHVRYLPRGFYAGLDGQARWWWFGGLGATDRAIPGGQMRGEAAGFVGWWSEHGQAWLRGGAHVAPEAARIGLDSAVYRRRPGDAIHAVQMLSTGDPVQPFVHLVARTRHADWTLAPRAELRAGWSQGQDAVSRTRLGGLNPYVVPVAGAAWAEFWVDTYAATRLGPSVQAGAVRVDAVVDAAVWRSATDWGRTPTVEPVTRAVGFGLLSRVQPNRLYVDVDAGLAPWLRRQQGVAWSVWSVVGVEWGEGGLARPD